MSEKDPNTKTTLSLYYTKLQSYNEKAKFLEAVVSRCLVRYSTARSWILKPDSPGRRNPKRIYWPILADITGIPQSNLFDE